MQVLQLTRTTRRHRGDRLHTEIVYAVTSLSATDAHPDQIATWLRGHWAIENRLHYVRDVSFDEDRSQTRTAGGPQVMATLRNTVISLLRLDDEPNFASARRHYARNPIHPIDFILTSQNATLPGPSLTPALRVRLRLGHAWRHRRRQPEGVSCTSALSSIVSFPGQ